MWWRRQMCSPKKFMTRLKRAIRCFIFYNGQSHLMKVMVRIKQQLSMPKKTAMELDGKVFKSKLQSDLNAFKKHTIKMIAQYWQVEQAWEMTQDATHHSKAICIDRSENMELYETQQGIQHQHQTLSGIPFRLVLPLLYCVSQKEPPAFAQLSMWSHTRNQLPWHHFRQYFNL